MTKLMDKAFHQFSSLPEGEQDSIASALLSVFSGPSKLDEQDEAEWDRLVGSDRSQNMLEKMALDVEKEIAAGKVYDADPGTMFK